MALPTDNGGATIQEVADFMLDVMAYSLRKDVRFVVGATIPETHLAPKAWCPRALLIDEPRGEPEEMANQHVGMQHVKLLWLVPIYAAEQELIENQGMGALDELEGASEWSLADVRRPSLVTAS